MQTSLLAILFTSLGGIGGAIAALWTAANAWKNNKINERNQEADANEKMMANAMKLVEGLRTELDRQQSKVDELSRLGSTQQAYISELEGRLKQISDDMDRFKTSMSHQSLHLEQRIKELEAENLALRNKIEAYERGGGDGLHS